MPPATKINHEQFCIDWSFAAASKEDLFSYWAGKYFQLLNELWFLPSIENGNIFGGINLAKMVTDGKIDDEKLIYAISIGLRLLIRYCNVNNFDNIIILLTNIPGVMKLIGETNLPKKLIDDKILAGIQETLDFLVKEEAAVIPKITFFGLLGREVVFH